jgi:hypothetical protein
MIKKFYKNRLNKKGDVMNKTFVKLFFICALMTSINSYAMMAWLFGKPAEKAAPLVSPEEQQRQHLQEFIKGMLYLQLHRKLEDPGVTIPSHNLAIFLEFSRFNKKGERITPGVFKFGAHVMTPSNETSSKAGALYELLWSKEQVLQKAETLQLHPETLQAFRTLVELLPLNSEIEDWRIISPREPMNQLIAQRDALLQKKS